MKSFSSSLFNINDEIVKPLFQITLICIENNWTIFFTSYDLSTNQVMVFLLTNQMMAFSLTNQMIVFLLTNQMNEIKTLPALNFLIISIANLNNIFRRASFSF